MESEIELQLLHPDAPCASRPGGTRLRWPLLPLTALLGLLSLPAGAADLPVRGAAAAVPPVMATWTFAVSGYVWAAGVEGTVATFAAAPPVNIDASFGDIIKNLGGAFMGSFEARYGRFILFNDLLFTRLVPDGGRTRGPVTIDASLDSVSLVGLSAAGYRLVDDQRFTLDLFAGVRGFHLDNEITVRVTAGGFTKGQTFSASQQWVDAIGGMRVRYNFDDSWSASLITFAGGGASKYQWDVFGGVGYHFDRRWSAFAGYRALKVNYRNGAFIYDVLQHGPLVGVQFAW